MILAGQVDEPVTICTLIRNRVSVLNVTIGALMGEAGRALSSALRK